jgi:hypothetical protein
MGQEMKCTSCKSFRFCRGRSVSKGSATCDRNRGLLPPRVQKPDVTEQEKVGILWHLLNRMKKKN